MKDFGMSRLEIDPEDEVGSVSGYQSDEDLLEPAVLKQCFTTKCTGTTGKQIATDKYILHLDGTKESTPQMIVGLSDFTTEVHHVSNDRIAKVADLGNENTTPLIGVKVSPINNNLVYTASVLGYVCLWDLRTPTKQVSNFKDTTITDGRYKPLMCFDVTFDDRVLSCGSEQFEGDAYILFWDIRNVKLLGGYWESHTDDITQVKFHPEIRNIMMSSSTDGLINIYNLTYKSENDALTETLNTESSVDKLSFHCTANNKPVIACTTHTNDIQFWMIDGAEPFLQVERNEITAKVKRKSENYCYTLGAHTTKSKEMFFLAGSNYTRDRSLRSLKVVDNQIVPYFMCRENEQVVRDSWFNEHIDMLVTGGESGILNIWNLK